MSDINEFLVPVGGIIAWHPDKNHIEEGPDGKMKIKAPEGWAICDGENGTSDLRGQFLRGLPSDVSVADFLENPAKRAGTAQHDHGPHQHRLESPGGMPVTTGKSCKATTTQAPAVPALHLPPYVNVVYIMKL